MAIVKKYIKIDLNDFLSEYLFTLILNQSPNHACIKQ